jgi:hypothetical protein
VEDAGLTPGEVALLTDGLTEFISLLWVLIDLGIRGNPSASPEPPTVSDVDAAFSVLESLTQWGLVRVGHLEHLDGGPPDLRFRHVEDPLPVAKRAVLDACRSGSDWERSCWVVNTSSGLDLIRAVLAES